MPSYEQTFKPYLDPISELEFIRRHEFSQPHENDQIDAYLTLATPEGKFAFLVEQKSSYFDHSSLNAFISQAKYLTETHDKPLLLFTRYVPGPSAERLISAGINFVDQVGNMHLALGSRYVRTIIGRKEKLASKQRGAVTPSTVQLLFTFAIYPDAGNWTVRQLANASGLSKSNVAKIKEQLLEQGMLRDVRGTVPIANHEKLEDELLRGYGSVLRPKLLINRFRAAESDPEKLIKNIAEAAHNFSLKWSLTGGVAAYKLQHFYHGPEIPIFIELLSERFSRALRIIPDAKGPLIFFRPVGTLSYWKDIGQTRLAHPWLIFSELMYSADPRAHEAAQELKREFLVSHPHSVDSESLKLARQLNAIRANIKGIQIVNNLFPALYKLRSFLNDHPELLRIGDNKAFYQKWLANPTVEMNLPATSSMWTKQTLGELHVDLQKIRSK